MLLQIQQTTFPVKETETTKAPLFLLPYDLPLIPYSPAEEPFLIPNPTESVPEALKLEEQGKPRKLTPVIEIARQLQALKVEDRIEKGKANQLILEPNNSQDIKMLGTTEEQEGSKFNEDNKAIEEPREMSEVSSEIEIEELKSEEDELDPADESQHDLFASL